MDPRILSCDCSRSPLFGPEGVRRFRFSVRVCFEDGVALADRITLAWPFLSGPPDGYHRRLESVGWTTTGVPALTLSAVDEEITEPDHVARTA
jgi:hypothetical protein